ncbi:gamma-glutamyltransferase, partial [Vibrio cholerae O1]|nr:gamma-glutamyltransferase [Vibrio cholerae O1]
CHIDVVDLWGNIISATPSGGWLQSSPVVPDLGFCLGTRLQMMWLDVTSPSALRPGRRPRTTLTPTLISKNG